ncbi:2Fe-2S iron-sulfur cluster-binding protein [Niveibacterium sp. SC-1]|uniref:2Fe-2S iron-sulfur cluster-binding protein n=1 Tax=Niveibacterium sp. SC-1 TaxID=3135646 RepID=UPI00311DD98E
MGTVTVLPHPQLCPNGTRFEARCGVSLCDALLANGIAIEHACEKVAACATCHVYVREGGETLAAARIDEEDQLDAAWGVEATSRLACCARLGEHDITIELPRHTRNLAREHG